MYQAKPIYIETQSPKLSASWEQATSISNDLHLVPFMFCIILYFFVEDILCDFCQCRLRLRNEIIQYKQITYIQSTSWQLVSQQILNHPTYQPTAGYYLFCSVFCDLGPHLIFKTFTKLFKIPKKNACKLQQQILVNRVNCRHLLNEISHDIDPVMSKFHQKRLTMNRSKMCYVFTRV